MSLNPALLIAASMLLMTGTTFGQDSGDTDKIKKIDKIDKGAGITSISGLLESFGAGDVVQMASDLRKASESLERFGESMKEITSVAAEAADSTSRNLAAIGGEFDPFGFKTAFETIQQQNVIIQAQNQVIMELQQKEILRLQQEIKAAKPAMPAKPPKRQPRRPKPSTRSSELQVPK